MRKLLSAKAAVTDSVRENMSIIGEEAEEHNPNVKCCCAEGSNSVARFKSMLATSIESHHHDCPYVS